VSLKLGMMVILWLRRPLGAALLSAALWKTRRRRVFRRRQTGAAVWLVRRNKSRCKAPEDKGVVGGRSPLIISSRITDAIVCNVLLTSLWRFGVRRIRYRHSNRWVVCVYYWEWNGGCDVESTHTFSWCSGAGGWVTAEDSPLASRA